MYQVVELSDTDASYRPSGIYRMTLDEARAVAEQLASESGYRRLYGVFRGGWHAV